MSKRKTNGGANGNNGKVSGGSTRVLTDTPHKSGNSFFSPSTDDGDDVSSSMMRTTTDGVHTSDLDGTEHTRATSFTFISLRALLAAITILTLLSLLIPVFGDLNQLIPKQYRRALSIASVLAAVLIVPITHGLGGILRYANDFHFFQPFVGGYRFVLLQSAGWTIYAFVVLVGGYVLIAGSTEVAQKLIGAIGIGGVVAQICVFASLYFFAAASHSHSHAQETEETTKLVQQSLERARSQPLQAAPSSSSSSPSPPPPLLEQESRESLSGAEGIWWHKTLGGTGVVGLVLTLISVILAVVTESVVSTLPHIRGPFHTISLSSLFTSAVLLGVPMTHVLAGRRAYKDNWSIYQPFQGGSRFIFLQALGWTLWACCVISSVASIWLAANDAYITGLLSWSGLGGVLAQAMVILSLRYFDSHVSTTVKAASLAMKSVRQMQSSRNLLENVEEVSEDEKSPSPLSPSPAQSPRIRPVSEPVNDAQALATLKADLQSKGKYTVNNRRLARLASNAKVRAGLETKENATIEDALINQNTSIWTLSWSQWQDSIALWKSQFKLWDWNEFMLDVQSFVFVSIIYFIPIMGAIVTATPFVIVYLYYDVWWVTPLVALFVAGYVSTFRSRPGFTGKMSWPWLRKNLVLWSAFERYFSGQLIPLGKLSADEGPYIFGFHPHGVYPMTLLWSTRGRQWQQAYPTLDVDCCGASIMFNCPLLREFCLWVGGREVSAASIRHALSTRRSILLIPGGQREMNKSRALREKMVIVTRHKGFIRMAIEQGVPLVPVISIGETFALENVYLPSIQNWTLRKMGVGFPVFPYGRWFSPIPNVCPITVVVGEAIPTEQCDHPSDEDIDALHTYYYSKVREMFDAHKFDAGYGDMQLEFSDE